MSSAVTIQTNNYSATEYDDYIICNAAGVVTVTLPVASASGKTYNIKNISNDGLIIDANVNGGVIDGEITKTINKYESLTVIDFYANQWGIV